MANNEINGFKKTKLRHEISDVSKGLVYLIDPPYNKNTIWDNSGRLNQEWKKHFYFIMTDPNFQGYVQVMQMTSQNKIGDIPISLPLKMKWNEKQSYIRCDSIWAVHSTYFKNSYFRGAYRVRKNETLPELDDFTSLCFDLYRVVNQIVEADSEEGMRILHRVAEYKNAFYSLHGEDAEKETVITQYESFSNPTTKIITSQFANKNMGEGGDENQTEESVIIIDDVEEISPSELRLPDNTVSTGETEKKSSPESEKNDSKEKEEEAEEMIFRSHKHLFYKPPFTMHKWKDTDLITYMVLRNEKNIDYLKLITGLTAQQVYQLNYNVKKEAKKRHLIIKK